MPKFELRVCVDVTAGSGDDAEEVRLGDVVGAVNSAINCDGFLASLDCVEHGSVDAVVWQARGPGGVACLPPGQVGKMD